jgi:formylglycine-generating enzyme required for sulfatase activity
LRRWPDGDGTGWNIQAQPWGLYDILGNVAEWVEDCYEGNYEKAPKDGRAVSTAGCPSRVIRGSSWYQGLQVLRAASRSVYAPVTRSNLIGFRLARTVAP